MIRIEKTGDERTGSPSWCYGAERGDVGVSA